MCSLSLDDGVVCGVWLGDYVSLEFSGWGLCMCNCCVVYEVVELVSVVCYVVVCVCVVRVFCEWPYNYQI